MTTSIRISVGGVMKIDAAVPETRARSLLLMAWAFPQHLAEFPEHALALQQRYRQEVRAALEGHPDLPALWDCICSQPEEGTFDVEVLGLTGPPGPPGSNGVGGSGGAGAWPGGGGGGGGGAQIAGGSGGPGADGAGLVIQWSKDSRIVDVQTFVTAGQHVWTKCEGVELVEVHLWGAGGGGGGGGRVP